MFGAIQLTDGKEMAVKLPEDWKEKCLGKSFVLDCISSLGEEMIVVIANITSIRVISEDSYNNWIKRAEFIAELQKQQLENMAKEEQDDKTA